MPRGKKSSVPEVKGLVTKASDIPRLKNPCVLSLPSVTRDCFDSRREVRLVSHVDFRSGPAPRAPRWSRGSGREEQPPAWSDVSGVRFEVPSQPSL